MEGRTDNIYQFKPFVAAGNVHPIRLLTLLPNKNFDDDLRCEVNHTSLEDKPEFEALSYTWGNPKDVVPLLLHDQTFHVTKNLASALRHLRYTYEPRVLWVDALCINQSDIPERNQQIPQMREIYDVGGAKRVVVWLGEVKNAKIAINFCERLLKEPPEFALLPGYDLEWEACYELLVEMPWWSRAWIIQEVIHKNTVIVHIGNLEPVSIEYICDVSSTFNNAWDVKIRLQRIPDQNALISATKSKSPLKSFVPLPGKDWSSSVRAQKHLMKAAFNIQDIRAATKGDSSNLHLNLPALVMVFRNQDTTDFRDKIYAFLGIANRGPIWHQIPIDYNLSKKSFYTIVVRAFINNPNNSLIPLLMVESHHRPVVRDQELPSWVSDYTLKQNYISQMHTSTATSFSADKGFPSVEQEPRFLESLNCEVLVLRGIYVGVIADTYKARITNDEDLAGFDDVKLIRHNEDPQNRHRDFVRSPLYPWDTTDPDITGENPLVSHSNTSWGPIHSEIGDIIIVAVGSLVPLVLREFEDGKYLFVGACWLIEHEIQDLTKLNVDPGFSRVMFGSACEGLPDDYKAEMFSLY
ncbi:Heterokaryon incompatibility protein [Rutstroemia sp. NJR-2017a BBW]|nr:Heterokaryon incompatibility protein [Rutstroemia sp. NJR-2017a BBW]